MQVYRLGSNLTVEKLSSLWYLRQSQRTSCLGFLLQFQEHPLLKHRLFGWSYPKMDAHVSSLCRGLHFQLSNIARIRPFITQEACQHATRALISTRLDYANSLLYGSRSTDLQRLQRTQNRAAKLIFKSHKHDHVTPLLKELHWLPVKERIIFKILTIVYKCMNIKAPQYLCSMLPLHNSRSPFYFW